MQKLIEILSTYTFGTPDFGHSDLWHFNLSLKFLLSQSLKAGYLPFWSKDIGTGISLLGEGEIGMFNLYNLFAFRFLNPILAFNLGFIVAFLTTFTGSYFFGRTLKLKLIPAILLATTFSLSGPFVTNVSHYNYVQTLSFLPWLFFLAQKYLQTSQKRWLVILPFVISQLIFSGHLQIVFLSLLALSGYITLNSILSKKIKPLLAIGFASLLGVILALPLLIPAWEMVKLSSRAGGVNLAEIARFPIQPKHLLSLFYPYMFGDPRIGTYPPFSANWGIFWESTGYIGIIPLLLALYAIVKSRHTQQFKVFVVLLITSLVLLLGKYTPVFFLFGLPPLSFFRVPGRFIVIFVWCLSVFAATTISKIKSRPIQIILLTISIVDLLHFAIGYNPIINTKDWLSAPTTVNILQKDQSWNRIYSVDNARVWNKIFLEKGWKNINDYQDFRNSLDPNQNLFWNISSVNLYVGLESRRQNLWQSLVQQGIQIDELTTTVSISTTSAKILSATGTKYFISTYPIASIGTLENPDPFSTVSGKPTYYIYNNPISFPHAYLTQNYQVANTIADLVHKVADPESVSVVVERQLPFASNSGSLTEAIILNNTDLEVDIQANTGQLSLLVLSDSYYPGWYATVDDQAVEILPVNINQRGVLVTKGSHLVRFRYQPLQIF